jgi:hypothetical protein
MMWAPLSTGMVTPVIAAAKSETNNVAAAPTPSAAVALGQ